MIQSQFVIVEQIEDFLRVLTFISFNNVSLKLTLRVFSSACNEESRPTKTTWRKGQNGNNYRWDRIARRRLGQQSCTGGISVLEPYMPDTGKVRM